MDELKFCKNCRNVYYPGGVTPSAYNRPSCTSEKSKEARGIWDLVTGDFIPGIQLTCQDERAGKMLSDDAGPLLRCGPEGKYFEEKGVSDEG
jgi:hypothetical protein